MSETQITVRFGWRVNATETNRPDFQTDQALELTVSANSEDYFVIPALMPDVDPSLGDQTARSDLSCAYRDIYNHSAASVVLESGARDLGAPLATEGGVQARALVAALSHAWRVSEKISAMFLSIIANPERNAYLFQDPSRFNRKPSEYLVWQCIYSRFVGLYN